MNDRVKFFFTGLFKKVATKSQNDKPDATNGNVPTGTTSDTVFDAEDGQRDDQEFEPSLPTKYEVIEEKHYNKIGFYCAIDLVNDPEANLKKALDEHTKEIGERIIQVTQLYNKIAAFINEKIVDRTALLQEERDNLVAHRNSIVALKEEHQKLLIQIEEIKSKLTAAYDDLVNKTRGLTNDKLKNRLDEVEQELHKVIENHQLLAEKKYVVNKRIFDDNKKVFDIKVGRFTRMKEEGEQAYRVVRQKIEDLSRAGISQSAVQFLNYAGVLGLVAAGWFYSVFILSTNIDSEDYLSFFLRRIINFGVAQFQSGNYLAMLLILIGIFIGLLALISLVVWVCHQLLQGRDKGDVSNELVLNFNEDGNVSYHSRINARSAFTIWMQLVPYIFVAGIAFILISLFSRDSNPDELSDLLRSLSGQFMGAVIALAATGIMVLYISLIIEPRLLRKDEVISQRVLLPRHWELITSIVLFMLLMVFIVFSGNLKATEAFGKPAIADVAIATASFFIIVLFTAFTLGYGIKYRGLYQEARHLETYLRNLGLAIEDNSRPVALDAKSIQNNKFRKEFETCQDEFFKIIRKRNELVSELFDDVASAKTSNRLWLKIMRRNVDKAIIIENGKFKQVEEKYFPELVHRITELESELQDKKNEVERIIAKIEAIENRRSELEDTINKKIQTYEATLSSLKKNLIHYEKEFYEKKTSLRLQQKIEAGKIKDGYDLGVSFRQEMSSRFQGLNEIASKTLYQIEA